MSIELQPSPLAPRIAELLSGLRVRIRGYVWTEGVAALVVALGLAFWLTLAFDWLFEPPWQFRAAMLVIVAAALLYVADRFLFRRAFRKLDDAEMAVLLERRFRDYRDSLLTTVELGSHPSHAASFNPQMIDHTRRQAVERSESVCLADVFRMTPLVRTLGLAAALAVSVLVLAVFARETFATWVHRVVLLDRDLLWPRANHVRVQGFPADRTLKVAKGSDFEVTAVADLSGPFTLPEVVQVRYRTAEGVRGRDNMSTVGIAGSRDREQKYAYVFKGVMSSIGFDVYGGDDRDRDFRIDVVENPTLSRMELACEYPSYTGRPNNTVPASALVQVPQGTKVTIHSEANKDLVEAHVSIAQGDKVATLAEVKLPADGDRRHFTVAVPELMEDATLLFDLHDADGIRGREPVRLVLAARADDIPVVSLRLRGISTAVTPQARLPAMGDVRDDYGLARLWFDYQVEASKARAAAGQPALPQPNEQPFHTTTAGRDGRPRTQVEIDSAANEALDLKRLTDLAQLLERQGIKIPEDLSRVTSDDEKSLLEGISTQQQIERALAFAPQVGDRLTVILKAADNCALPAGANVGQGERYQLDIVAPEQLLSMLEGRELMLRRQFEIIFQEMTDTRDALALVKFTASDEKQPAAGKAGQEPGENAADKPTARTGDEPDDKAAGDVDPNETPEQRAARLAKRAAELRDVRVARALDNGDRAAHETLLVADSFEEIREEMTNNRVDTPELQIRIKDNIADPLRQIATQMFPVLKSRLTELRRGLDDPTTGPARLKAAVDQEDAILRAMSSVLDEMLKLETLNELIDTLRDIIAEQERLKQQTNQRQQEELRNKLRGLQD